MTGEELEKVVSRITLGTTFKEQLPLTVWVSKPKGLAVDTWVFVSMSVAGRRWHTDEGPHPVLPIENFDVLTPAALERATEEQVVKGVFLLIRRTLEHELKENFYLDGKRIYDPHHEGLAETEEKKARDEALLLYGSKER